MIDGCPPGLPLDEDDIQPDLERRRPGKSRHTTQRRETDAVRILSGVFEGATTGTPINLMIENVDQRPRDYSKIKDVYRPSHADYTYHHKYGVRDYRGGGRSSARETAMRVAAGAIARKYLRERAGVVVRGYLAQLGPIRPSAFDWDEVERNPFFCPDPAAAEEMARFMDALRKSGDSIGARIDRGTVGGNLCLADPQGDPPAAAIALRAVVRATTRQGSRDIPATRFFTDLYTTALGEDELLKEVIIPPPPEHSAAVFGKFAARRAMDYTSTVSVAVHLVRDPNDGCIAEVGLGLGGAGLTPAWPQATEAVLAGRVPGPETFAEMRQVLFEEIEPITDHLYSADYKRHVAWVVMKRTLDRAFARAAASGETSR